VPVAAAQPGKAFSVTVTVVLGRSLPKRLFFKIYLMQDRGTKLKREGENNDKKTIHPIFDHITSDSNYGLC
jgi:hypothetical protein